MFTSTYGYRYKQSQPKQTVIIHPGDDLLASLGSALTVQLYKEIPSVPFTIDPGATVTADLIYRPTSSTCVSYLPAPVSVLEAAAGSDWANSLLVVEISAAATSQITESGKAWLKIIVDDGGVLSWDSDTYLRIVC